MQSTGRSIANRFLCTAAALMLLGAVPAERADAGAAVGVNAFSLSDLPSGGEQQERLFRSLKDAGADTVIVGPVRDRGPITKKTLPHIVVRARSAGLKLFVIVPTRGIEGALSAAPEWEDQRYDLESGTIQPDGKLDLFHPDALEFIVRTAKRIASLYVDGILLGEDFVYGDTEGMGSLPREQFRNRFKSDLVPGRAFAKVVRDGAGFRVEEYGEGYRELERMKSDRLTEAVKAVIAGARSVNRNITVGVPLPFKPYGSELAALPEYRRVISDYHAAQADYFWIKFPSRKSQGLQYKEGMEAIARTASIIAQASRDKGMTMFILTMATPSGRLLPFSEIEEATEMARKGGTSFIAYQVGKDTNLPAVLTKKLFRTQDAP